MFLFLNASQLTNIHRSNIFNQPETTDSLGNNDIRFLYFKNYIITKSKTCISIAPVTQNGDGTAFVQRSKNLSVRCAVADKYAQNIKFASYSVYTTSSQRPYRVHTTLPQRPWRFYGAQAVAAVCSRHVHGSLTAFSRRSYRLRC